MGFFTRGERFVADERVAAARAAAGAAFLDRTVGRDWHQLIDVDQLDIGSATRCVLGQLARQGHGLWIGPARATACGFSCGLWADTLAVVVRYRSAAAARSYDLLAAAWKALIRRRRQPLAPRQLAGEGAAVSAARAGAASPADAGHALAV
jgi:hypothetical protein